VLITDPAEAVAIDQAPRAGLERTGGTLAAARARLVPVCRFYGSISPPNSHSSPPTGQRGRQLVRWHYEGIAFYIQLPANRLCAAPQKPVWRAYNNGFRRPRVQ
jgi:hypothetical protein